MGMGQLRDVLWRIFAAVLLCDVGNAHIEDVCGTNWAVGKGGDEVLNDVWIFDKGVCDDLAASVAGSRKGRRMIG